MDLGTYIFEMGDEKFARKMGLSVWTARDYRLGIYSPSPESARRILSRSRGKLKWGDIYNSQARLRRG